MAARQRRVGTARAAAREQAVAPTGYVQAGRWGTTWTARGTGARRGLTGDIDDRLSSDGQDDQRTIGTGTLPLVPSRTLPCSTTPNGPVPSVLLLGEKRYCFANSCGSVIGSSLCGSS